MVVPNPRDSRPNELRLRLLALVRGIQEPGMTHERKAELAAELEDWIEIQLIDQIQQKERQMVLG